MASKKPLILITNDSEFHPGIQALISVIAQIGNVIVNFAPRKASDAMGPALPSTALCI